MDLNRTSNVNSNRTKHTMYARLTSIFKKLDNEVRNELENEKKLEREKK